MNSRNRLLIATGLLALVACGGRVHSDQQHYRINVIYRSLEGEMVETSTGETRKIDESVDGIGPNPWCMRPHLSVWAKTDMLPVTWSEVPSFSDLVPFAAAQVPPGSHLSVIAAFEETCHSENNIQAAVGGVYWKPRLGAPKEVVDFRCIYDHDSKDIAFVDFQVFEDGGTYNAPSHRTFFDVDGDHFYYQMHGMAKRFSISDGQIDTIAAGEFPMIPWNDEAVIVYSESDQEYRLLDDTLAVTASISGDLEGEVLTVYMLDKSSFIFGCKYIFSPHPLGVDAHPYLALYELDFELGTVRELHRKGLGTGGQILSVERVE